MDILLGLHLDDAVPIVGSHKVMLRHVDQGHDLGSVRIGDVVEKLRGLTPIAFQEGP